ncbi:hypothetical protein BDV28DRAFT_151837 [Aspergillus coremiiformis]|uniref:Uncharacterized protein n=1 Tax=Aspergillus coremiiformis TaxID=138285 RepID=A0A5N6YWH6_9EURO|nr:hypothetical protein BDV28DRAFT_151837 [Aspergillus coremiiformis]
MKYSVLIAGSALLTGATAHIPLEAAPALLICWQLCAHEKIPCPTSWYSKKFGHCYTCCKGKSEEEEEKYDLVWQA